MNQVSQARNPVRWQWSAFRDLDGGAVHAMLHARQQVFVLEQRCLYPDIDALDLHAHHLLGWHETEAGPVLAAYLRCLAPGTCFDDIALGRVLTVVDMRGQGLGRALMIEGMTRASACFPGHRIRLSAQAHLAAFYVGLGFACVSDVYLEDDIPHIAMLR